MSKLTIKIKRFDKSLPLPEYKTNKAAALDLSARETVIILPKSVGYVPLNIAFKLPPNYFALMAARSSLHKKGVMMANGIGIGDEDYSGNNDEYRAVLFNFTDQEVVIEKGERIVQLLILNREKVTLEEVEMLDEKDRGGIGSTGFN
jgi:dUTP pyrophosphatase